MVVTRLEPFGLPTQGLGTELARQGTFRGLNTERARLGTFRGFGTERARLGTFRGFVTKIIWYFVPGSWLLVTRS